MKCWKKSYTKKEAQTALNAMHGYSKQGDKKIKMYRCQNGFDHYHLTKAQW